MHQDHRKSQRQIILSKQCCRNMQYVMQKIVLVKKDVCFIKADRKLRGKK